MFTSRFFLSIALVFLVNPPAFAQIRVVTPEEPPEEIELLPPNYVNPDYGFGMFIPDGYTPWGHDEGAAWLLDIAPQTVDMPSGCLSVEKLPDGVTDVAGFWQVIKEREPLLRRNTTYERNAAVANTGAIQARIERLEGASYILVILWVWVHDGYGFTFSGYPPREGDYTLARGFAKQIVDQFRWMTDDEIAEALESMPPQSQQPPLPPATEF